MRWFRRTRKSQRGQAIMEFILVLIVGVLFTRYIYYNREFGFKASLDKTILRLGSFLEQNLKSGTKVGGNGRASTERFMGTQQWSN